MTQVAPSLDNNEPLEHIRNKHNNHVYLSEVGGSSEKLPNPTWRILSTSELYAGTITICSL